MTEKEIFVKDLQEGTIKIKLEIYEKIIRQDKNDNDYIQLSLGDKTGTTKTVMFFEQNQIQTTFQAINKGDIVELEGQYGKKYNSILVNSPSKVKKCNPNEYSIKDFRSSCDKNLEELIGEIKTTIDHMKNDHLKNLLKEIFDEQTIQRFKEAPSAMFKHHNYGGGNLEHTVGVLKICKHISQFYEIDEDLLFSGAILHDIGKIQTYTFENTVPTMTDEEKMISHVVIGYQMVNDIINKKFPDFPDQTRNDLSHLILSHHGQMDWGSPVSPKTPEAVALHHADLLDSRVKNSLQRKV